MKTNVLAVFMDYFQSLRDLLEKRPEIDTKKVERAYLFAKKAHEGQLRKSGEEYITHPVEVAKILLGIGGDEESIIATLLHDTVEDTGVSLEEIEGNFGGDLAKLVDGVTKIEKSKFFETPEDSKAANLRKILSSALENERAILIKLCDRAHNIKTIKEFSGEKQRRIAQETMEIYQPLAKIFGVWEIKRILEDECFPILDKKRYEEVSSLKEKDFERNKERNNFLAKEVREKLEKEGISPEVSLYYKSAFEISEDAENETIKPEEIRIFSRIDIFTNSIEDCYKILGVLHKQYSYSQKEFQDYISVPKNNGYQSLHTGIFINGELKKINIQTQDMHLVNEKCAFFLSPQQFSKRNFNQPLQSLNMDYYESKRYLEDLKKDILQKKILVITPSGEKIILPEKSSGIDLAYAISANTGHRLKAIRVNNQTSSPTTIIHNGDIVEILLGNKENPEPHWINYIKTGLARQEMIAWESKLPPATLRMRGKELLKREIQKTNDTFWEQIDDEIKKRIFESFKEKNFDEVLKKIGLWEIDPKKVVDIFTQEKMKKRKSSYFFRRIDFFLQIFYSIFYFLFTKYRQNRHAGIIRLEVIAKDRAGMLYEILGIIAKRDINIASLKVFSLRPSFDAFYKVWLEIEDKEQFIELLRELSKVDGVKDLIKK